MKRITIGGLLATVLFLVMVPSVLAWPDDATVQLSSTPGGTSAGQAWEVDVSFVSQGRLITADLSPTITIREESTGRELSFPATSTARGGMYHASVVFPTDGAWTYSVLADSYGPRFDFPAVRIAPEMTPTSAPSAPVALQQALPILVLAILGLALIALGRQQRRMMVRG